MSITLRVSGFRALFPRPEFSRDRISFDVPPQKACRNILDRIYLPEGVRWHVRELRVLGEIRLLTVDWPRGEAGSRALVLQDVDYLITASLSGSDYELSTADEEVHLSSFSQHLSRAADTPPFLGHPDFLATVAEIDARATPDGFYSESNLDLGWMPLDDHGRRASRSGYFRAKLVRGTLTFPLERTPCVFR